ncbi:DUF3658 domain-containing protein [Polaromonas sp. YR568]|uniref:DUF3658 domain-containing protein n=1 Tax=Polaromonas sp. YR568 TaxID=1855301 RepID=UPI00398BE524
MERKAAEEIFAACELALSSLTELETAIAQVSDSEERKGLMQALSRSITEVLAGVRAPVVIQYRDIEPFDPEDAAPYEPTEEEVGLMRAAPKDVERAVDAMIVRTCTSRWQKVAKIVGNLIPELEQASTDMPIAYIQARMDELEDSGKVEIAGDVWAMRYSEIRLAQSEASAA